MSANIRLSLTIVKRPFLIATRNKYFILRENLSRETLMKYKRIYFKIKKKKLLIYLYVKIFYLNIRKQSL